MRYENVFVIKESASGQYVAWGEWLEPPAPPALGSLNAAMPLTTRGEAEEFVRALRQERRRGQWRIEGPVSFESSRDPMQPAFYDIWRGIAVEEQFASRIQALLEKLARLGVEDTERNLLTLLWEVGYTTLQASHNGKQDFLRLGEQGREEEALRQVMSLALMAVEARVALDLAIAEGREKPQ